MAALSSINGKPSERFLSRLLALSIAVMFFFTSASGVFAIGISPPRAQLDFVPSTRYDMSVMLINNQPFPIEVETRVDGILAPTTAIRKPITIGSKSTTNVPIAITTPESLSRPGYHTTYIFFAEKYLDESSGTISTRTEVGLKLVLWQPYPGDYAEIVASAPSVPEGQDTALKVVVNNLGTASIVDGKATVRILDAAGALQDVFTFPNINVPGNSNEDYYDTIRSSGYNPGKYVLESRLEYGSNVSFFNGSFAVGTRDVDIIALEGPIYLDKPVNRYTVHIESLWNEPFDAVFAKVQLGSGTSQTPSSPVSGFGRAALTGFWETDGSVQPGVTTARVNVSFPGGSREELVPITVEAVTPKPPDYEEPSSDVIELSGADAAMILLALVVVVLVIVWIVGESRRRKSGRSSSASTSAPAKISTQKEKGDAGGPLPPSRP